ncbi:Gfo/Idh/MocA family protein [Parafilimonas sp.]|uniref:Gfo/Idh/MocA family protein n=1 Tax=Parafilimonas sp. TaxID=1969739 RepID=UPI0039E2D0A3
MRWGIIGPGNIAREFANDLQYVNEDTCEVGAVLGQTLAYAKAFADEHGGFAIQNINDLIVHKPDAVYIATPHSLHYEHAMFCLENKIPVLCEKPLAINEKQVYGLIEASKKNNTFLMEGLWTRFLPSFQFLFDIIQSGTIGEILQVHADMSFIAEKDRTNRFFNPELGGGSLLDVGVYTIYLSYLLLGNPDKIFACGKVNESNIDETCGIALSYSDGKYAMLESSIITQTQNSAWIYGSKGTIRIKRPWTEHPEKIDVRIMNAPTREHYPSWQGRGFQYEVDEVIQCLKSNTMESNIISHKASLNVVRIMDAVRSQLNIVYPYDKA